MAYVSNITPSLSRSHSTVIRVAMVGLSLYGIVHQRENFHILNKRSQRRMDVAAFISVVGKMQAKMWRMCGV